MNSIEIKKKIKKKSIRKKSIKKQSKKNIKGGVDIVSNICKNASKIVNPYNTTKVLFMQLLDVILCKKHYFNLNKKWKKKDPITSTQYNKKYKALLLKESRLLSILLNRNNFKIPKWLWNEIGYL